MAREFDFYRLENRVLLSGEGIGALDTDPGLDAALLDSLLSEVTDADAQTPITLAKRSGGQLDSVSSVESPLSDQSITDVDLLSVTRPIEVIFVDERVGNVDGLLSGLRDNASQTQFLIVELTHEEDGVSQITSTLSQLSSINAIHIVSHADREGVLLGDSHLGMGSIEQRSGEIAGWGLNLAADADILIYGCNLASTVDGQAVLESLSLLTGADVAGSTDLTGSANFGGNWELEYTVGAVETIAAFQFEASPASDSSIVDSWEGLLATLTVTNATDIVNGTTTSIAGLIASDGGDGISLREAIQATNNTANVGAADEIHFAIGSGGPVTITLSSSMDAITGAVRILGNTQPQYSSTPLIEIDGNGTSAAFMLDTGSDGSEVRGFIVHSTFAGGIRINGTDSNVIAGNWVGTDAAGTGVGGSGIGGAAIIVNSGSQFNVIGGTGPNDANVLNGANFGVYIQGLNASQNTVIGNLIGTDYTGTARIGNAVAGVGIYSGASFNTIGGDSIAERNVISGNAGQGLRIESDNNTVHGNYIGVDINGDSLGNTGAGIEISGDNNDIGGVAAGEGNTIANNGEGVVVSALATNNQIVSNRIYGNGGIGIDLLGNAGVTPNDVDDTDTGGNDLLNTPVIQRVVTNAVDEVIISGDVQTDTPNQEFRIEFYDGDNGLISGPGLDLIGETIVTTDGNGYATFYVRLSGIAVDVNDPVRATATLQYSGTSYGNTSEFSAESLATTNSAPAWSGIGPGAAYTENDVGTLIQPTILITDDSGSFDAGSLRAGFGAGQTSHDWLRILPGGNVTLQGYDVLVSGVVVGTYSGGHNGNILTVNLNANSNAATTSEVAQRIAYANTSDNPSTTTRIVNFFLTDDLGGGAIATGMQVTVGATNDPPVAVDDTFGLAFDGVDDYVLVADDPALQLTDTFTIEAWINPDSYSATMAMILAKEGEYEMAISPTGNLSWAFGNADPGWTWHDSGYQVALDQWTHVALTYDNGIASTYVNGNLVDTYYGSGSVGDAAPGQNDLRIGWREQSGAGESFDGQIDEVRLWDIARQQSEILNDKNASLPGSTTGLVGYWDFNQGAGAQAEDVTASGNHGLLVDGGAGTAGPQWIGFTVAANASFNLNASVGPLQNDLELEGDTLAVVNVDSSSTQGVVVVNGIGGFSYDPNNAFDYLASGEIALDQVTYTVEDSIGNQASATAFVRIIGVNDSPSLTNAPGSGNGTEGLVNTSFIDDSITISDIDSSDLDGGQLNVSISSNADTNDQLMIADGNGVTVAGASVSFDGGTGPVVVATFTGGINGTDPLVITFNNNASAIIAQAVARQITFQNLSDNPTGLTRTISTFITDGDGGVSATDDRLFDFARVNDDPYNAGGNLPGTLTFIEDTPAGLDLSALAFIDVDDGGNPLSLKLTSTNGTFTAASSPNVTIIGFGTDTVEITGTQGALNSYINTVGNVVYQHAVQNTAGLAVDSISVAFNDNGNIGTGGGTDVVVGLINVDMTPVNDSPVWTNQSAATVSFIENSAPQFLDPSIVLTDPDSGNFDGGTLQTRFFVGATANDHLEILSGGNVTVSGSDILVSGVSIGTLSGGTAGTDLVVNLNASSSANSVAQVARRITYYNDSENPSTSVRIVGLIAQDGDGGSASTAHSISLIRTNDAPIADGSSVIDFAPISEDDVSNPGQSIVSLLASVGDPITDVDNGAVEGIAVTQTTTTTGIWEYSIDDGTSWNSVGMVSDTSALLLRDTDRLRFVPDQQNAATAQIQFHAWDQSTGIFGTYVDASLTGGLTALSDNVITAQVTTTDVNDAPVLALAGSLTLADVTEDDTDPAGSTVSSILATSGFDTITDVDASGVVEGIAVTAADTSNGAWQYRLLATDSWINLSLSVSDTNALLLSESSEIRFVPLPDYAGPSGNITFRAWDQTSGTTGSYIDASINGDATSFSMNTRTALLNVVPFDDAATIDLDADDSSLAHGGDFQATFREGDGPVAIADIDAILHDVDTATMDSLVVRITNLLNPGFETLAATVSGGITQSFNSATGELTLSSTALIADYQQVLRSVTYENTASVLDTADRLIVFTTSDGATATTTITVDVNDPPSVSLANVVSSIAEDANTSLPIKVADIQVSDDGLGTNDLVIGGFDAARFHIVASQLFLNAGETLDFETDPTLDITIEVDDQTLGAGVEDTVSYTLNVVDANDAPSLGLANVLPSVAEDIDTALGIAVADIIVSDDALGVANLSLAGSDSGLFEIVGTQLRLRPGVILDYENDPSLEVSVLIDDPAVGTMTDDIASIVLTVTDANEFDITSISDFNPGSNVVLENAAIGTDVGITALATDADSGDTVAYSLDNDDGGRFTIDAVSGVVSVAGAIDREVDGANRFITIRATSSDGSFTTETLGVAILDANESSAAALIDSNIGLNTVDENSLGAAVGVTAFSSDDDSTDTVSYSLDDNDGGRFTIDASTGVVTVAGLIDAEVDGPSRTITVRATSTDGSWQARSFDIDVNDINEHAVSPVIDSDLSVNQVIENTAAGTIVGITADAFDLDVDDTITFALLDSDGGRFAIDAAGVVTVAGPIDFEVLGATRSITVQATSADGSFTQQAFAIDVLDVVTESNVSAISDLNAAPESIIETIASGTAVGFTALASDPDATDTVSYSLIGSVGRFAIDSATGVVSVADNGLLDYETATSHDIVVRATSTDGSFSQRVVTINLQDVNEFGVSPVADSDAGANEIAEDATIGTTVGLTAFAFDGDATSNAVTYSLTDTAGGRFAIDTNTGLVTLVGAVSFADSAVHTIEVQATSVDGSSTTQTFGINVLHVNQAPVATGEQVSTIAGQSVAIAVLANDVDGDGDSLTAIITSQPANGSVVVGSSGDLIYTPVASFVGTDSFTYQVSDGTSNSEAVSVQVTTIAGIGTGSGAGSAAKEAADEQEDSETEPTVSDPVSSSAEETELEEELESEVKAAEQAKLVPVATAAGSSTVESEDPPLAVSVFELAVGQQARDEAAEIAQEESQLAILRSPTARTIGVTQQFSSELEMFERLLQLDLEQAVVWRQWDEYRIVSTQSQFQYVVGTAATSAGIASIGYVIWIVRGGAFLTAVSSSVPAWRVIDPTSLLVAYRTARGIADDEVDRILG